MWPVRCWKSGEVWATWLPEPWSSVSSPPALRARIAQAGSDPVALAALPYSFTTVWQAVHGAGLAENNARHRKVLVSGAAGGLGQLALQLLRHWGALVTAVDLERNLERCAGLGAAELVARESAGMSRLPADFAAVLNFGSWADDALLARQLGAGALGYATTVHPLLGNFDSHGLLKAAWTTRGQKAAGRAAVCARSPSARYAWTIFRPSEAALDDLAAGVAEGWLKLPIGKVGTLEEAAAAFAHVEAGGAGRAVLRFGDRPEDAQPSSSR
jgi:reticulon-4-interacting protein 1, mitochondrial